ncbi:MAG: type II toxin-antitoxin system Phd/YefM family antitoxin [Planctomycetes bacterium]|nr:type II toxin-antitoxin system Phd/YefM family antitoxin [Planctomycetota bacterium]
MTVTASALRKDIYKLLDEVVRTGKPLEIERKGVVLKVIKERTAGKWEQMVEREGLNCSGEELVETSWAQEWKP